MEEEKNYKDPGAKARLSLSLTLNEKEVEKLFQGWNPKVYSRSAYIKEILLSRKVRYFYVNASWDQLLEEMVALKREWREIIESLKLIMDRLDEGKLEKEEAITVLIPLLSQLQVNQHQIQEQIHKIGQQWLQQYGSLPAQARR